MRVWPLLVLCLCYVYLALSSEEEKDWSPLKWIGGLTKMDDAGGKAYNGVSTRAQLYDDVIFLCNPRLKPGMEATLLKRYILPKDKKDELSMEPFPAGVPQTVGDCKCLQSTVDMTLDPDYTLWVLDVGLVFPPQPNQPPKRCPPKIVGYNIHDGKVEKTINLENMIEPMSRLQFIALDYSAEGKRFLYVSDAGTKSIIVWDVDNEKGVRVGLPNNVLEEFKPRDVLYIILIRKQTGNNLLYFTYRSGDHLYCIETKYLQAQASSAKSWNVGKKSEKMIFLGSDETECLYFKGETKPDVCKWNTSEPFTENNIHVVHRTTANLTPTHAMPDFKLGVMKLIESNLIEYLAPNKRPMDSVNCLSIMTIPT